MNWTRTVSSTRPWEQHKKAWEQQQRSVGNAGVQGIMGLVWGDIWKISFVDKTGRERSAQTKWLNCSHGSDSLSSPNVLWLKRGVLLIILGRKKYQKYFYQRIIASGICGRSKDTNGHLFVKVWLLGIFAFG